MKFETVLENMPKEGFLKLTKSKAGSFTSSQKAALIRKGNELFNGKDYGQAKKIFLATGYSDGISRIGDYHYKNNDPLEALRMYILAPDNDKKERLIKKMAYVVQTWLSEKD